MIRNFTSLVDDYSRYLQSFKAYQERSSEYESMKNFIHGTLSDILSSVGKQKSSLNVLGVGSGSGEIDLEILTEIHAKHPGVRLENEVVEPSAAMLKNYKDLVSKMAGLDHVTFKWHNLTSSEFMSVWKEKKPEKKMDFIHMIQMMYYEKDLEATISFYQSLLSKNGKLLIVVDSEHSGLSKLLKKFNLQLCKSDMSQSTTAEEITNILDAKGIPHQIFKLMCEIDITECFMAGNKQGELLLDLMTEVVDFKKNAPPELLANVMALLEHPECSRKVNGRILLNSSCQALVLDTQC